ncbi:MAG: tetratricopeptide repeat protein, partial [Rhodospirillaceae bacterium]
MRRPIRILAAAVALACAAGSATAQQPVPSAEAITHLYQEARRESAAGRHDRAEVLLTDAVAQAARLYGPAHAHVGVLLENLAGVQEEAGRLAAAAASLRRSADVLRQAAGADSIEYFTVAARLGSVLMRIGRMAEAEAPLAAAYDGVRRLSSDSHPGLVRIARDLAWLYRDTAAFDKAAAVQDFLLPLVERLYGRDSADFVRALAEDAEGRVTLGRIAEAEATIRRALQIADAIPSLAADVRTGLETAETSVFVAAGELRRAVAQQRAVTARLGDRRDGVALNARYHLGLAEWNAGNHAEAWRQFDAVAAGYARHASAAHPVLARIALARAQIEARLGHGDRALQHGNRALAIAAQSYGEGSARMAMFRIEVAALLADQGHDAAATAAFEAALAVLTRSPAEYGRHIVTGRVLHGKADLRAGRFADAAARFDRALADSRAIPGYPPAGTAEILVRRAQALAGLGRLEEAAAAARESARLRTAMGAAGTGLLGESLHMLAGILRDLGQADEARATALRALNLFDERRFALLDDPSAAAERDTRQGGDIVRRYLAIETAAGGRDEDMLFRALQLANDTAVARTVSRVAARLSAGAGAGGLAELLRDLQDDVTQYRAAEELRARQDAAGASTAALDDRLMRLRTSLDARRGALQQRFPEFIDLLRPLPLPLAGVQALLSDDEALFVSVAGEGGTHVALVRRQAARLWLSPLPPA